MKGFAISNIAWELSREGEIRNLLNQYGFTGVELALSKIWPQPALASKDELLRYKDEWLNAGVEIVALQSLLFGKEELTLFGKPQELLAYLKLIIERAAILGARSLVFGSPKNRKRGALTMEEAVSLSIPFFKELGAIAADHGVVIGIEANPPIYGADFLIKVDEAAALVASVNHAGVKLHLDSACMLLIEDPLYEKMATLASEATHIHLSAPQLGPIHECADIDYKKIVGSIRETAYDGWVSIEMKSAGEEHCVATVEKSLALIKNIQ
jgi:D-psicose/D-tagatose/L-ribulose 3-epimerase